MSFMDEARNLMRSIPPIPRRAIVLSVAALPALAVPVGCSHPPPYGVEHQLVLPGRRSQVWAVAPAVNLSGMREVDPILQSDLLFQQLQEVRGLTVIPVNRVVEVYAGLKIEQVQSAEQARLVCDLLGCDALVVPTVTAYDAYDPPKFGGALQLFPRSGTTARMPNVDPRELARAAAPAPMEALPPPDATNGKDGGFVQAVGMFDATNGSVRDALFGYAHGRQDPVGPMGKREYLQSMDRYVGFAYHTLVEDLLRSVGPSSRQASASADASGGALLGPSRAAGSPGRSKRT